MEHAEGELGDSRSVGRPRDPEVADRVQGATLKLLLRNGYNRLRIDDVVKEAGVAKTTVYRRWPSLPQLVMDTVSAAVGPRSVSDTGDLIADAVAVLRTFYAVFAEGPLSNVLMAIGTDLLRHQSTSSQFKERFVEPLRQRAISLLQQGVESGQFTPLADPQVVVDAITGAIVFRWLLGEKPPPFEELVAMAYAAMGVPLPDDGLPGS